MSAGWWVLVAWWVAGVVVLVERATHRHLWRELNDAALQVLGALVVVVFWPAAYLGPWLDKRAHYRQQRRRR